MTPPDAADVPAPTKPPRRLLLGIALTVASAVVGVVASFLGETPAISVKPEQVMIVTMGNRHPATTPRTVEAAGVSSAARMQALLGLSLGLVTGIAVAIAFGNPRRLAPAAITGLFTGAAVGFGVARLVVPLFYRHRLSFDLDLIPSILLHGGLAASIGLTSGLAAAIGAEFRGRKLLESLFVTAAAAFLGGTVYVILGAALYANDDTGEPVSLTFTTRLLSHVLVAVFIALGTAINAGINGPGRPGRPLSPDSRESGRADFPDPTLGQELTPSPAESLEVDRSGG